MNITELESIVGPINRGQLASSFKPIFEVGIEEVQEFFSDDKRKARPALEDLSHLNKPTTKKYSDLAKGVWKRLSPSQRKKRMAHLRKVGMIGGSATKDVRHMHGS